VRDASNGPEFVAEAERRCGLAIRVLSGADEARLSAQGVLSGIPDAEGVMGDLGGGSLELVAVRGGKAGSHITLPIGPMRLLEAYGANPDAARKMMDDRLDSIAWLGEARGKTFYPVGGAWRSLARLHMQEVDYPLHVIHEYGLSRRVAEDFARVVSRLGRRTLAAMPSLSKRRAELLPMAALLLERLLRLTKPDRIVFSAHGLREGHLYSRLSAAERARDPLIAACSDFARAEGRFGDQGATLDKWISPLFADTDETARRLRRAACSLSDVGWRDHSTYRAQQAFQRILHLPVGGIDHAGRVALAIAVSTHYAGTGGVTADEPVLGLLQEDHRQQWVAVGLALRLAYALSGGVPELLRLSSLSMAKSKIVLQIEPNGRALVSETVTRRLEALGRALGRDAEIKQ
jgi:exopolyphosphatase/guanosine-5'-triphosphate,3'-diphosphate pyrophosphatase